MPSHAATICAICDKEVPVASNPNGQTPITYYHGDCYRSHVEATEKRMGWDKHPGSISSVSHDERVQSGELLP